MEKKRIYINFAGGLGNQLLQYFGALYLQKVSNFELVIDVSNVDSSHTLGAFDLTSFVEPNRNFIILKKTRTSLSKLIRILKRKFYYWFPNNPIFSIYFEDRRNINFLLDEIKNNSKKFNRLELEGWFGDFYYFQSLEADLRKLSLKNPSSRYKQYSETLSQEKYVSVHLRFGDYLTDPDHYGVLSKRYYDEAFKLLNVSLEDDHIVVFTNDQSKVAEFLSTQKISKLTIVDSDPAFDPAEVLLLMSGANKLVLANSTFSYVAALIAQSDSNVAFPRFNKQGEEFILNSPANWYELSPNWL